MTKSDEDDDDGTPLLSSLLFCSLPLLLPPPPLSIGQTYEPERGVVGSSFLFAALRLKETHTSTYALIEAQQKRGRTQVCTYRRQKTVLHKGQERPL